MRESLVHDLTNAVPVDVVHGEHLNTERLQDVLLTGVNVAQPDVHSAYRQVIGAPLHSQVFGAETRLEPHIERGNVSPFKSEKEGDRAAVEIARVGCKGRVDVGVRINLLGELPPVSRGHTQITAASGYWLFVPATVPIA